MLDGWRAGLIACVLVLAGCGGGGSGGSAGPASIPTDPPPVDPTPTEPTTPAEPAPTEPAPAEPAPAEPTPVDPPSPPPSSGGTPFAINNPFAVSGGTTVQDVKIDHLRIFGDSYSTPGRPGTQGWARHLQTRGFATTATSYAQGGGSANPANTGSFADQLDFFAETGSAIDAGDLTVVYLGHNDIFDRDLAPAKVGYSAGIDRLVAAGAARDDRRLFVTMLHDWSRNPGASGDYRGLTEEWNGFVQSVANSRGNVVAVDLFTVFERVFADPAAYGFTNVTTPDAANAGLSGGALYVDEHHFGDAGQGLVARVFEHYLTRAWDWSNSLNAGSQATLRLQQDLNNGLIQRLAQPAGERRLGLGTLALGSSAAVPGMLADRLENDPSRAGFAEAHGAAPVAGGIALDYGLDEKRRFGLAIARYDDRTEQERRTSRLVQDQGSDALALYWQQEHAGFAATTQFAYLRHQFDDRAHDDLLGHGGVNGHGGSSWALDQTIARPTRAAKSTITPWVSLGYQSHELEPYAAKSLYTSDLRFSGDRAIDIMSGIGLDVARDAIALGGERFLWLSGGLAYRTSLYRDDVEVEISEAALPGLSQRETIERERIERFDLTLGAVMSLAHDLHLRAGYGFSAASSEQEQWLRMSLAYRF